MVGITGRGDNFNITAPRDGGCIEDGGINIIAGTNGFEAAGVAQPRPLSLGELVDCWRHAQLTSAARRLDQLYHQDGNWISKESLARFLGCKPTGGSWNRPLGLLRRDGLVEARGDPLRATRHLWQEFGNG